METKVRGNLERSFQGKINSIFFDICFLDFFRLLLYDLNPKIHNSIERIIYKKKNVNLDFGERKI